MIVRSSIIALAAAATLLAQPAAVESFAAPETRLARELAAKGSGGWQTTKGDGLPHGGFGAYPGEAEIPAATNAPVVHEWGSFTTVAGADGAPVQWVPLSGASDLPCFVYRLDGRNLKQSLATVRMETPVLYFYVPHATTFSVHIEFPAGLITEWYPNARITRENTSQIDWDEVEASPAERSGFPVEAGPNHYYAARGTDASPIRAGQQHEKMIFYRGLGSFSIPMALKLAGNAKVEMRPTNYDSISTAILFENHGGRTGYRIMHHLSAPEQVDLSELTGGIADLQREMENALAADGLYRREAHAMIETWRDSWFEEGTRVFYILPRAKVDNVVPLTIIPRPAEITRVFVGRAEILTPWMEEAIVSALAAGDIATLERFGRFLSPFISQIARKHALPAYAKNTSQFLAAAHAKMQRELNAPACGPSQ